MEDIESTKAHLREHVTYPATKQDIIAACNNMSHTSADDVKEFGEKLPEGNYQSADEVITALQW